MNGGCALVIYADAIQGNGPGFFRSGFFHLIYMKQVLWKILGFRIL